MSENEIPKYLKKSKSDTSKCSQRSSHKHVYEKCYLMWALNKPFYIPAEYCIICGRVRNMQYFWNGNDKPLDENIKVFPHPRQNHYINIHTFD